MKQGDIDEAIEQYAVAFRIKSDSAALNRLARVTPDSKVDVLVELIANSDDPKESAQSLVRSTCYSDNVAISEKITAIWEELDNDYPDVYYHRGLSQEYQQNYEAAVEQYAKAMHLTNELLENKTNDTSDESDENDDEDEKELSELKYRLIDYTLEYVDVMRMLGKFDEVHSQLYNPSQVLREFLGCILDEDDSDAILTPAELDQFVAAHKKVLPNDPLLLIYDAVRHQEQSEYSKAADGFANAIKALTAADDLTEYQSGYLFDHRLNNLVMADEFETALNAAEENGALGTLAYYYRFDANRHDTVMQRWSKAKDPSKSFLKAQLNTALDQERWDDADKLAGIILDAADDKMQDWEVNSLKGRQAAARLHLPDAFNKLNELATTGSSLQAVLSRISRSGQDTKFKSYLEFVQRSLIADPDADPEMLGALEYHLRRFQFRSKAYQSVVSPIPNWPHAKSKMSDWQRKAITEEKLKSLIKLGEHDKAMQLAQEQLEKHDVSLLVLAALTSPNKQDLETLMDVSSDVDLIKWANDDDFGETVWNRLCDEAKTAEFAAFVRKNPVTLKTYHGGQTMGFLLSSPRNVNIEEVSAMMTEVLGPDSHVKSFANETDGLQVFAIENEINRFVLEVSANRFETDRRAGYTMWRDSDLRKIWKQHSGFIQIHSTSYSAKSRELLLKIGRQLLADDCVALHTSEQFFVLNDAAKQALASYEQLTQFRRSQPYHTTSYYYGQLPKRGNRERDLGVLRRYRLALQLQQRPEQTLQVMITRTIGNTSETAWWDLVDIKLNDYGQQFHVSPADHSNMIFSKAPMTYSVNKWSISDWRIVETPATTSP